MSALEGIAARIVSEHTEGCYAAWLLAGLGARVEVVSRVPRTRLGASAQWLTADATCRDDPSPNLDQMAAGCDALLVDAGEQLPAGLPAEVERLHAANPELVIAVVSPYGLTGPDAGRRATHQELQARSGLLNETGRPDGPPVPVYGDVVRMATGANAALALLLGLWRRRRGGPGALVDVAGLETAVGLQSSRAYAYGYTGLVFRRSIIQSVGNYLPCKDGSIHIYPATTTLDLLLRFLEIDESSIPAEVLGLDDKSRQFAHPELYRIVSNATLRLSAAELVERGLLWRIPVTPALTPAALLSDEHLRARGFFREVALGGGTRRVPSYPFRGAIWSRPERAAVQPAPAARPEPPPVLPLAGVRVTELGTAWSGPMAAEILALSGAEVVKVEAPAHLDTARSMHLLDLEPRQPAYEYTYNYHPVNGGKLHFGLDVDGPGGREVARRLLQATDVVVTNLSMRSLTNLGLDGISIQAINSRCSVVHSTSAGLDGPYSRLAGYGSGMEMMTGVASATASAAGLPGMIRSQLLHPDVFGALHQALAAVASLFRRERTGAGTLVDLSQFECGAVAAAGATLEAQAAAADDRDPPLPLRLRCAGDDQWLAVTVSSEADWSRLRAVLRVESLARPLSSAREGIEGTAARLGTASAAWTKGELASALQAQGVAAEPVATPDEMLLDRHLRARDYFVVATTPRFGTRHTIGRWHHFADNGGATIDGVHWFGQDNDDILTRVLRCTPEEAAGFQQDGTVGPGPYPGPAPAAMTAVEAMLALGMIYRWDADYRERLGLDSAPAAPSAGGTPAG